jgi:hypothetical protein
VIKVKYIIDKKLHVDCFEGAAPSKNLLEMLSVSMYLLDFNSVPKSNLIFISRQFMKRSRRHSTEA